MRLDDIRRSSNIEDRRNGGGGGGGLGGGGGPRLPLRGRGGLAMIVVVLLLVFFGGGDTITVINLGNSAYNSTSSGYFSSSGKDILFSNNVNGTASVITLVGAVTAPGLVYDEASAEQAVGFDFISFRFA
jgi:predicted metalloprotease